MQGDVIRLEGKNGKRVRGEQRRGVDGVDVLLHVTWGISCCATTVQSAWGVVIASGHGDEDESNIFKVLGKNARGISPSHPVSIRERRLLQI